MRIRYFGGRSKVNERAISSIMSRSLKFMQLDALFNMSKERSSVPQRKLWSMESMTTAVKDIEDGAKGLREAAQT